VLATRQQQSIDQPLSCDQYPLGSFQLRAEKPMVETGVVDHQRRIANESEKFIRNFDEALVLF